MSGDIVCRCGSPISVSSFSETIYCTVCGATCQRCECPKIDADILQLVLTMGDLRPLRGWDEGERV
jgi:hypothetical protein